MACHCAAAGLRDAHTRSALLPWLLRPACCSGVVTAADAAPGLAAKAGWRTPRCTAAGDRHTAAQDVAARHHGCAGGGTLLAESGSSSAGSAVAIPSISSSTLLVGQADLLTYGVLRGAPCSSNRACHLPCRACLPANQRVTVATSRGPTSATTCPCSQWLPTLACHHNCKRSDRSCTAAQ